MGGMAGRATLIERIREEGTPVLLVDSGDIVIGTALSSWFRGELDIKAMDLMGYQAMAAGNHDFDFGLGHLWKLRKLAAFPILCTNLIGQGVQVPCDPFAIIRVGDLSIGLLGVVGRSNFPETFNRDVVKHLDLTDPIQTVQRQARLLKEEQRVDLVVVLTHQDTAEDLLLLKQVPELDVMVGGHTKGFDGLYTPGLHRPVSMVRSPSRVYVKTHRQGRTLGRLDLWIEGKVVVKAKAENIPVTASIQPQAAVQQLLNDYIRQFAGQAHVVVGQALVDLQGARPYIRTRETNLGDLLADLLRKEFGAHIALVNGGQIRTSLSAGPVTLGDVLAVLPFDSSIVTLQLSGAQIRLALENSVSRLPRHAGRFLQISGLKVLYDVTRSEGDRVRSVTIDGKPLEARYVYSVATDSFLADGGDGYAVFKRASGRLDHQIPLRDILLKALAHGPLKAETDQRIRFIAP